MKDVKAKYTDIVWAEKEIENLIETNEFLCIESDEEMANDLLKSTARLKNKLEKLETKMFLSGKFDKNNAIITLHPGAGGTESQDWAQMLYRMYSRWASQNRIQFKRNRLFRGRRSGNKKRYSSY